MPPALSNRGPPPPGKGKKKPRMANAKARSNASTAHCSVQCLPASTTATKKRSTRRTQGRRKNKAARIKKVCPGESPITTRAQRAADRESAKTKSAPDPAAGTNTQIEAVPEPFDADEPEHTEDENPLWDDQMHWSDVEEFGAPMINDHWDVQMHTSDVEGDEE